MMKRVLRFKLFTFPFLLILIFLSSCREDIITPNSPITNINEPVTLNYLNYYSFVVNARNASYYVVDSTNFDYSSTRVLYTVSNHSNGSVLITLKDQNHIIQYQSEVNSNRNGRTDDLKGVVPNIIEIDFFNFTGVLQLQLIGYLQ